MSMTMNPQLLQQVMLAVALADRAEEVGSDYEDGTYEQGVCDALRWVAGITTAPPLSIEEYPELAMDIETATELLGDRAGAPLPIVI